MANGPQPESATSKTGSSFARRLGHWRKISARPIFRLVVFGLAGSFWFLLIVARLWDLQVRQADSLTERAHRQQEALIEILATRGAIYDRLGGELALSTPVASIGVIPSKVRNRQLTASLLAEVLGTDAETILRRLEQGRFQWIKRLAEPGETERVRHLNLPGIHFEQESKRYYPKGTVASHVLGAVGVDHQGLAGLEQSFEKTLRGEAGARIVQHDALQNRYSSYMVTPPVPGSDLILTIDQKIQMVAERELNRAVAESRAAAGTIVVMDPKNGAVFAMANWPTFDPNRPVSKPADLEKRRNFAITNLIEPGSTFKLVTVAGALEQGLTRPTEVLDCQMGGIRLGSRLIRDHKPFDHLTVSQVVAFSSNVGAIKLGLRLEPSRLYEYARRFGFGRNTGLPLPGEIDGILRRPENWHPAAIGSVSIGQEIGVTAIQMARAVSTFANGGLLVQPRIVEAIVKPDGTRERVESSPPIRILQPETAATMRAMMELTVREGTGRLAQTPGYRVGGKTGTAQKVDPETGAYSRTQHVPSFVGFAPVNDPAIVVVIVLDSPETRDYHGGQVAGPIFPRVARPALRFLDVPAELPPAIERRPASKMLASVRAEDLTDFREDASRLESSLVPARFEREADGSFVVAAARRTEDAVRPAAPMSNGPTGGPIRLRVAEQALPDFRGQTVRSVVARAATLGLHLEMRGGGMASRQWPAPGTPVNRGDTVSVEFVNSLEGVRGGR
jgi:cell division protein FtsI (penicillin-binding protein 3)